MFARHLVIPSAATLAAAAFLAGCAYQPTAPETVEAPVIDIDNIPTPTMTTALRDEVIKRWDFDPEDGAEWEAENDLEPLAFVDGIARTTVTGPDAFLTTWDPGFTAESVTHVVVRMRSTVGAVCQIYYATDEYPNPAENEIPTVMCAGDNIMRDYVFDMTDLEDWSGMVTYFRLDPINGVGPGARVEIDSITLERRAPRLRPFALGLSHGWLLPGRPISAAAEVYATDPGQARVEFLRPGMSAGEVTTLLEGERRLVTTTEWPAGVFAGFNPVETVEVRATNGTGATVQMRTPVLVADPSDIPAPSGAPRVAITDEGAIVEGRTVSLAIMRGRDGYGAAVLRARNGAGAHWRVAGAVAPLAVASWQGANSPVSYWEGIQFDDARIVNDSLILTSELRDGAGTVQLAFSVDDRVGEMIVFETKMTPGVAGTLHRLSGPVLLAGEGTFGTRKDDGVFPGIEFLGPDEPSSATEAVGETLGYRPRPQPFAITVPLMAVSYNGLGIGMMWDALQEWDATSNMPRAEYASPNFLDGGANHRMALYVPGGRTWGERNAAVPSTPYEMVPGQSLLLRGRMFASYGEDSYTAVPLWYRVYGQPEPVETALTREETLDVLMEGWGTTCYDPEVDGFVSHWRWLDTHSPMPHVEAKLVGYAHETGNWELAEGVGQTRGTQVFDIIGPITNEIRATGRPAIMDDQRADGTWPYTVSEMVRENSLAFTDGERDSLGVEGTTNAGIIAFSALQIIPYAQRTGDPEAIDAILRAIDACGAYSVPRGSQVWEVHMDIPDIFASANIVDLCVAAYEWTGDPEYLDTARAWAYTGLPFLYSYRIPGVGPGAVCIVLDDQKTPEVDPFTGTHPASDVFETPDRNVAPYASIPVFGTSYYTVNWFGNIVQWCGVRWANAIHRLDQCYPDPVLRTAAEGVVESAREQIFDKGAVVGLFPDSWNAETNQTGFIFIGPAVVEEAIRTFENLPDPGGMHVRPLFGSGGDVRVATRGRIIGDVTATDGGGVTWTLRAYTSQATETVLLGVDEPDTVTANGESIPRAIVPGDLGWMYDADMRAVSIHRIAERDREVFLVE